MFLTEMLKDENDFLVKYDSVHGYGARHYGSLDIECHRKDIKATPVCRLAIELCNMTTQVGAT